MPVHVRQKPYGRLRRDEVCARESRPVEYDNTLRVNARLRQKLLDGVYACVLARLFRACARGFAERAQDEFGVEILARLQCLRSDDGERGRTPHGYFDQRRDWERLVRVGAL